MRASAILAAVASARLAVSAAIPATDVPAEGVPITELDSYPDLLTSTEAPADISLAAAYAGTANELTDGTPCRAVTLICKYDPDALAVSNPFPRKVKQSSNIPQTPEVRHRAATSARPATSAP